MLHYFCEVKFKSEHNLQSALDMTRLCLINDNEMPVKVEAAIALQVLISNQEKGKLQTRLFLLICYSMYGSFNPFISFVSQRIHHPLHPIGDAGTPAHRQGDGER